MNPVNLLNHTEISAAQLRMLIRKGEITLGGNKKLKIYGLLSCKSGKRMKAENRVFFKDEQQAIANGFRPCGNCKRNLYKKWIYSVPES
ncbi:Metal-binding protein [Pedobacter cryoconitis]|uniref:Metal-binding protein n=1 Tax=Pedobacter cryoconitis TaxID=188932 RepID=A0A127VJJ2_9SPHI|nr:Ada metal-binding domain-containing protein [Pedobacter cryoconitis]AMQ01487.1 Metal-binding protein [Pedobacter cryoconitis]